MQAKGGIYKLSLTALMLMMLGCVKKPEIKNIAKPAFTEMIQEYQRNVRENNCWIDTSTFNLVVYLGKFDRLKMRPGLKCYFLYVTDLLCNGAYPALYAESDSFKLEDYIDAKLRKEGIKDSMDMFFRKFGLIYDFTSDSTKMACNNIIPEDSEEGYLQYLFFHEMGDQFALHWHANYMKKYVIANSSDIYNVYVEYDDYNTEGHGFRTDPDELVSLLIIHPLLTTKMEPERCLITWYEIDTHLGIHKKTYSIERHHPYLIKQIACKTIVDIDCHIIY